MSEGAQILIIEDEKDITNLLRRVLTAEGYTIEIAETGAEALQKVEDNQFYLAILDIRLPDISSMEVLRALRERQPQIPMVILTGYPSRETAEEARQLGVKNYITKPLDLEQLKEVVREIVEEHIGRPPAAEVNLLDISVADFQKLSDEQRENLQIEAYKLNEDWILQELNRLKAMWILVCGGKVVRSSPSLDDYPSPAGLREIEENENLVPFVFVGPLMLRRWNERRTGISKWQSRSPIDDWYTTIQIRVGRPNWNDNTVIEKGIFLFF
jgi:DNA-binding response OmpR family regulator